MSEELNKYIHTVIMGKCWHEKVQEGDYEMSGNTKCKSCDVTYNDGLQGDAFENPDYTSPNSPRRLLDEVEKVVVEKVGVRYLQALIETVEFAESSDLFALNWAIATPEQRATACRRAWEGEGI